MTDRDDGEIEPEKSPEADFAAEAEDGSQSFLGEFWDFLIHNKRWWLTPILIVLLVFGLLVILGGTGVAPFVYTLF